MNALLDLNFSKFIAPTIAKIVYVLAMVGIAVGYLIFVVTAFNASVAFGFLTLLIIGPLMALIYLVLFRVGLESLLATILTAQNTSELVRLQTGQPPMPPQAGTSPTGPSSDVPPTPATPPAAPPAS